MLELTSQIETAAEVVARYWKCLPRVGVILGTGLGQLAEELTIEYAVDYAELRAIDGFQRKREDH